MGVTTTPEGRLPDPAFWEGTRVLLTGHTGFKGSWLARWLHLLGAEVHGLALDPLTSPAVFDVAGVARVLVSDERVDLRDAEALQERVRVIRPEVVLHLAAQPLVREGYRDPASTFATNVAGTANLLATVRSDLPAESVRAVVVVTSDKVYRADANRTHPAGGFCELDPLGGDDPYSASKAMVEGLVDVFRRLPAIDQEPGWSVPIGTARAGNVIGGGDWAADRLVPDCIRAFRSDERVVLRYPDAVRPWQHVLDPLAGYLVLAEALSSTAGAPPSVNFGPDPEVGSLTVREVARTVAELWGAGKDAVSEEPETQVAETGELRIDSGLAAEVLGWRPRWSPHEALARTVEWYRAHEDGQRMDEVSDTQIREYTGT
jgi:CDP-glucose 4,6-dehydratase